MSGWPLGASPGPQRSTRGLHCVNRKTGRLGEGGLRIMLFAGLLLIVFSSVLCNGRRMPATSRLRMDRPNSQYCATRTGPQSNNSLESKYACSTVDWLLVLFVAFCLLLKVCALVCLYVKKQHQVTHKKVTFIVKMYLCILGGTVQKCDNVMTKLLFVNPDCCCWPPQNSGVRCAHPQKQQKPSRAWKSSGGQRLALLWCRETECGAAAGLTEG